MDQLKLACNPATAKNQKQKRQQPGRKCTPTTKGYNKASHQSKKKKNAEKKKKRADALGSPS